jgi:hypothetical protein
VQGHFAITTYTPIARLPIMQPSDPAVKDSWGLVINAALPAIEQVAAGIATVDLTGLTSYTLLVANDAPDQARQAMLVLTGAPTATCTVTIPSVARIGWVTNSSTQTVQLGTAGAAVSLAVPAGATFLYTCDGTTISSVSIGSTTAVLNSHAGVVIGNSTSYYNATDPAGVVRPLMNIGADGFTNLFMGGSVAWRVLNQNGSVALMTIFPSGAAVFANSVTVNGPAKITGSLEVDGTLNITDVVATIGSVGGVVFPGGGVLNTNGIINANDVVATIGSVGGVVFPGGGALNTNGAVFVGGFLGCTGSIFTNGQVVIASTTLGSTFYIGGDLNNEYINFSSDGWKLLWQRSTGTLYFIRFDGATLFAVNEAGNVSALGAFSGTNISDVRTKQNITPYTRGLADLIRLEPISYQFNGLGGTTDDGTIRHGLAAQAAQPFIPECVSPTRALPSDPTKTDVPSLLLDGQLSLDPAPLTFALINAVKELAARVGTLEARLAAAG